MTYIDGFVAAVPNANREAYRVHAVQAAEMFHEYGALRLVEAWGDDVPPGKRTDFRRAVDAMDDETVVFSWIEWPSKEVRDAAHKKMASDSRMNLEDMPFDGKRMIYGGFAPIVDEQR